MADEQFTGWFTRSEIPRSDCLVTASYCNNPVFSLDDRQRPHQALVTGNPADRLAIPQIPRTAARCHRPVIAISRLARTAAAIAGPPGSVPVVDGLASSGAVSLSAHRAPVARSHICRPPSDPVARPSTCLPTLAVASPRARPSPVSSSAPMGSRVARSHVRIVPDSSAAATTTRPSGRVATVTATTAPLPCSAGRQPRGLTAVPRSERCRRRIR